MSSAFVLSCKHLLTRHTTSHQLQEEIKLKEDTFGPLKPITREEYRQIWQSTGIDIDGRQEYLAKVQLPNMEMAINRFVAIVKGYPGFQKLPMEDQISLVKG